MDNITRRLAQFVAASRLENIDASVRKEATRSLLNWLGCAIGGSRDSAVTVALSVLSNFSGGRQVTVLGRAETLDALSAAFINGLSSSVHTFDDTHLATLIHPTGPIAAALLALSEIRLVSGADFLHALILGMEIECRLGNAIIAPPAEGRVGWFMTGLTGAVGAAAAVGKALSLSETQLVWALGHAVLQAAGVRASHASMAQNFPTGHASRAGLLAALLAEKGFTNSERSIEGPKGFVRLYSDKPHLPALTDQLGERYELLLNTYKPYPCGIVIHPAIDACLEATGKREVDADLVERISLSVHPLALDLTGQQVPENSIEAQFSVHHWVSAALLCGAAGVEQGTNTSVQNPGLAAVRLRVSATANPTYSRDEASIDIRLRDGRVLAAHVHQCRGSTWRPLSDAELDEKFGALVGPLSLPAGADRLRELCWAIDQQLDAGLLARLCSSST